MFDGDLIFSTNNNVLLQNYVDLPALNCVQYKAKKIKVSEKDIIKSNKQGFGSQIGQITNRITEMTSMMSYYSKDSEEYKVLKYRTQCGQTYQQNEIDKAKGIVTTPMPKSWYVYSENKINDDDDVEIIKRKRLYQRICANKKPYFFIYNYPSLKKLYDTFVKHYDGIALAQFNCPVENLWLKQSRIDAEEKFLNYIKNKSPVSMAPSTVNKICWAIENAFNGKRFCHPEKFDVDMIKSGCVYSSNTYHMIWKLYAGYNKQMLHAIDGTSDADKEQIKLWFKERCDEVCPNALELCDILIDMCYNSRNEKEIVWFVCGETIIQNLLKHNNYNLYYPKAVEHDAEFGCRGKYFIMQKVKIGDAHE